MPRFRYPGTKSKKLPDRVDALTRKRVNELNILPIHLAQLHQGKFSRLAHHSGGRKPALERALLLHSATSPLVLRIALRLDL